MKQWMEGEGKLVDKKDKGIKPTALSLLSDEELKWQSHVKELKYSVN